MASVSNQYRWLLAATSDKIVPGRVRPYHSTADARGPAADAGFGFL